MKIDYKQWAADMPIITAMDAYLASLNGCQVKGCDHQHGPGPLFLHGRCHPAAKNETFYYEGSIFVACAVCKRFIARFKVAE